MIEVKNLTKSYSGFTALANVSFSINKNEFVVFLGANGSGKSTLFKCLAGITDYEGKISVGGFDPILNGKEVRSKIGFMSQYCGLHSDLTIEETLRFYSAIRKIRNMNFDLLLHRSGLFERRKDKVGNLSGGMKQRLLFIISLIGNPEILILDEPLASLDLHSFKLLIQWLNELKTDGKTILVSTHLGQEIHNLATRFIVLDEGKITSQPVSDFLSIYHSENQNSQNIHEIRHTGTC